MNLRDFLRAATKLKESIFKNNNQIKSTVTTRAWVLSAEWTRAWPITGLVSRWKSSGGPRLFEWQVLFFRVWGYCILLTKMKTYCQCNFTEIFKGRQIILEPCRNSKYPIRCLLWCHKTLPGAIWTQAYSEPLSASKMGYF